jgi:hypothetical protein
MNYSSFKTKIKTRNRFETISLFKYVNNTLRYVQLDEAVFKDEIEQYVCKSLGPLMKPKS